MERPSQNPPDARGHWRKGALDCANDALRLLKARARAASRKPNAIVLRDAGPFGLNQSALKSIAQQVEGMISGVEASVEWVGPPGASAEV